MVKTPLKKMREVLHAGQRLGTNLAEVEELRAEIRRREWEESAKRVILLTKLSTKDHVLSTRCCAALLVSFSATNNHPLSGKSLKLALHHKRLA